MLRGIMRNHLLGLSAAALFSGACIVGTAQASAIPSDAVYGDTFASPGSRGTNLVGHEPEINLSGQAAAYSNNGNPQLFSVGTLATSNGINNGTSGVLEYADHSNADTVLLLPLPASVSNGYVIEADIIPFPGASRSAIPFAGVILKDTSNGNFFGGNAVRFGIGGSQVVSNSQASYTNEWSLLVQDHKLTSDVAKVASGSLSNFDSANWNHLRVEVKPAESVTVYFNGQLVQSYSASQFDDLSVFTYVGLEAIAGHTNLNTSSGDYPAMPDNNMSAYFDNFSVSPIPEPATVSMLGVCSLILLGRRR